MKRINLLARWSMVFGVLGIFTAYSVAAYTGLSSPAKAYAATVSEKQEFQGESKFLVVDDAQNLNLVHRTKKICAINQEQLTILQTAYDTTVVTADVNNQTMEFAKIEQTDGVTKPAIYQRIGVDVSGPKCQIVKVEVKTFLLLVTPGVS